MGLRHTQGNEKRHLSSATFDGIVALSFIIPSSTTCLRQVKGGMNMGKRCAIQAQRAGTKNQPSPEGLGP